MLSRRSFLTVVASVPFVATGCARRAETPLVHLQGEAWVHGAYQMYAQRYLDVQKGSENQSHGVYRVLAQKGITALSGLQSREVPFFMRLERNSNAFQIERTVPERLTFTANMSAQDREDAQETWKKAREHIHTDYTEIHRLNWSMTTLLAQLERIRSAMEEAELEEFKIVRQLGELRGGGETPFELPKGVSRADYERVQYLLVARLEDDSRRLETIEASIVAVGLAARATDAGSGSLATNIAKVLLNVMVDADATEPSPAEYPKGSADQERLIDGGKKLVAQIEKSPAYLAWKRHEEMKVTDQIGNILSVADAFTHIPTSAIFRECVEIWRGDGDYLAHLKNLSSLVPAGGKVGKTIIDAIDATEKARRVVRTVQGVAAQAKNGNLGKAVLGAAQEAALEKAGGMLNTSTQFGRARLERQLAFLETPKELKDVQAMLQKSRLMTEAMPYVPIPKMPQ